MSRISRRTFLRWAAGTGAVLLTSFAGVGGWLWVANTLGNVGSLSFRNRLRIPPLLAPSPGSTPEEKVFELTLERGVSDFLPRVSTPTWGVNGSYLGPRSGPGAASG